MLQDILMILLGLVVGAILGFFIARNVMKKYIKKNPPINEQIAAASVVNAIVFPNILAEPNIWTTHKSITALKNNVPAVEIVFDDSNAFSTISPSRTKNLFKLIMFS